MRLALVLTVLLSAAVGLVSSDGAEPGQPAAHLRSAAATPPIDAAPEPNIERPILVQPLSLSQAVPPPAVAPMPYVAPNSPHFIPTVLPYQPAAYGPAPYAPQHGDVTRLRQEFIAMAKKHTERMDGPELQKGIAEMRRQWLIAELAAFSSESHDDFDDLRAKIAVGVLRAKDQNELASLTSTLATELAPTVRVGEQPLDLENIAVNLFILNAQNPSYLLRAIKLLTP